MKCLLRPLIMLIISNFFIVYKKMCIRFILGKLKLKSFLKNNLQEKQSFTTLAKKLNEPRIIIQTQSLLEELLFRNNENNPKYFLSIYMIIHHPKTIITKETELELRLLYLCNKLNNVLFYLINSTNYKDFYVNKMLFNLFYTNYLETFISWKDYDKNKIKNDLHTLYFELEGDKKRRYDDIDNETNKIFIDNIEREQQKILDKLYKIGGQEAVDNLKQIQIHMNSLQDNIKQLYSRIQDNLHKSYWHHIRDELSKDPPNNMIIIDLLKETKDMLLCCNKNLKSSLDQYIDIPFIEDMIKHNSIDNKTIVSLVNWIITQIQELQASVYDEETEIWKKEIIGKFEKGMLLADFFPMFFKGVFEKLQRIIVEVDLFREVMKRTE